MQYESNFKQVKQTLEERKVQTLETIGDFLLPKVQAATPVAGGTSEDGRYRSNIDPDTVTRPGLLRDSYKVQIDTNTDSVQVGTNIIFAETVESEQPHLVTGADENLAEIRRIGGELMKL